MKHANFFLSVLGVLLLAGLAYAQPPKRPLTTIKAGYIPLVTHAPTFAAIKNGFFEEEGLKAELTPMAGGAAIIPAIAGGSLDVGYSAYTSIFIAVEQGLDFTIVAPIDGVGAGPPPYPILVLGDSPIKRPRDFDGRVFGVNTLRAIDWLYAVEWVAKDGGDSNKVIWQEMPFPAMAAAVRTKKIDGGYIVEPFLTIELGKGGLRSVGAPFDEVDPKLVVAGWTTTTAWIKKNQESGERFIRAFYKGMEFVNKNPDKTADLLATFARIPPGLAPKIRLPLWAHPLDMQALNRQAELALKWGLLKKKMDVNKIVWPTALR